MNPDERGPILHWLAHAYADLSDGQRWTIGILLVLTVAFVGFGLRQPLEQASFDLPRLTPSAQARPATAEQTAPSSTPAPVATPAATLSNLSPALESTTTTTPSSTTTTSSPTTTTTTTTAPPAITVPSLP